LSLFKNANARSVENTVSTSLRPLHEPPEEESPQHFTDLSVFNATNALPVENTVSTSLRPLHEPPEEERPQHFTDLSVINAAKAFALRQEVPGLYAIAIQRGKNTIIRFCTSQENIKSRISISIPGGGSTTVNLPPDVYF
jgi:hypothetical protein